MPKPRSEDLPFSILIRLISDKASRIVQSGDVWAKEMQDHFQTEEWRQEARKVAALKPLADKLETIQACLAIAWVLEHPHVGSAITGASRPEQVLDALRSLDVLPKLTEEIMGEIHGILCNKPETLTRRFAPD